MTPTLENCIIWGNTPGQIYGFAQVAYSDIEGSYTGVGNINAEPGFVDPDMDGDPRVRCRTVDMGADVGFRK